MQISLRRLRQNQAIRELTREVRVSAEQMIQPHFVVEGITSRQDLSGLSGVYRETTDSLLGQVEKDLAAGINKILLFGVPKEKRERDFNFEFTARQVRALRENFGGDLWIATDICLCSATTHGQCGVINDAGDHVLNPESVTEIQREAIELAQAGADCVAPSDMMDGRVQAIRSGLDAKGLGRTAIMSYSAKFHSGFYGPFREAADSAPRGEIALKDRATYQIDPARPKDALESSLRDAEEGADILMVKPGLPYLDVLAELSRRIPKPWAVYQVSGEYAAIELMAREGLVDAAKAHTEAWTSFVRAGASIIITYGARHAPKWLGSEDIKPGEAKS